VLISLLFQFNRHLFDDDHYIVPVNVHPSYVLVSGLLP
jgi:hypothetical protein